MWQAMAALGSAMSGLGTVANVGMQFAQNRWQKNMQEEAWDREDEAVQRRVADLKAAGLSPVLAAGNAASSTNPISIMAPQIDTRPFEDATQKFTAAAQAELALQQQKAQIDQTNAQTAAIKQQQDKTALEMAFMTSNNPLQLDLAQTELDYRRALNPYAIERAVLENKGIGIANANALLDKKLKTIGIKQADQALINAQVDEQSKRLGLTQQEKDIAAKQIAIDMATQNLDNLRWDTDWYHQKNNLPFGFNGGTFFQPALGLSAQLDAIRKYLKGGK